MVMAVRYSGSAREWVSVRRTWYCTVCHGQRVLTHLFFEEGERR